MSAFEVNDDHIRYLLRAFYKYDRAAATCNRPIEEWRADGAMLRNANHQSVNHRYEEHAELVTDFDVTIGDLLDAPCTVPQTFMAIHCMEYQCCEPEDWEQTPAYEWLQRLARAASKRIDGYDDCDWEIDPSKQPRQIRNIRRLV